MQVGDGLRHSALPSLRRLLVQRTRWAQGTMQCIRYAPRIWRSSHVSTAGTAEILYYLVQPWLQLLGSLAYPLPWLLLAGQTVRRPDLVVDWFVTGQWDRGHLGRGRRSPGNRWDVAA